MFRTTTFLASAMRRIPRNQRSFAIGRGGGVKRGPDSGQARPPPNKHPPSVIPRREMNEVDIAKPVIEISILRI